MKKIAPGPNFLTEERNECPEILDRILENCSFCFRDVMCPNKNKVARITAVKFLGEDAAWLVEECSLSPEGKVKCAMSCLLRNFDPAE